MFKFKDIICIIGVAYTEIWSELRYCGLGIKRSSVII